MPARSPHLIDAGRQSSLKAGVPQLVAPCCYDQFDNAAHLRRFGVSRTVARDRYTPAHVATILRGLLDVAHVRRCCAEIAARFDAGTALSSAADALEQYWKERDSSQFDPEVSTHTILQ